MHSRRSHRKSPRSHRRSHRNTYHRKSSKPPEHVPPEILEQIFLKLPVNSLLRFSTVSKSWNSMIFESRFVREHQSLAVVNGRHNIVTIPSLIDTLTAATSVCRLSLTSSERPIVTEDSTFLPCLIKEAQETQETQYLTFCDETQYLRAFCDELWLVEVDESLYLLNQSMRSYRKLPKSPLLSEGFQWIGFAYGLAYDAAADDYKVLKIVREDFSSRKTEVYSLKSNSWKTIPALPVDSIIEQNKFEFVKGAFHWFRVNIPAIVSFNLSSEKYGEIALPPKGQNCGNREVEVVVWRGKLCVSMNNQHFCCDLSFMFELWVMEEYGVEESWSKVLQIEFSPGYIHSFSSDIPRYPNCRLRALCFYDNGHILFNMSRYKYNAGLFMYEKETGILRKFVAHDGRQIYGGFLYFESLVSPWYGLPR